MSSRNMLGYERKIKDTLEKILTDIESSGSFLTSGSFEDGINPGLEISAVGPVGLPISEDQAKFIRQSCHVSPYGKGSETLVDDSVRKSWELNVDQFSLRNPAWQKQIQKLMVHVVSDLGLIARPEEVQVELYKLLVYEEGAFFLPHQDSEKTDGMFGTLVVCLPSKHEGGDVIASHKGQHRSFKTSPSSEFGFSFAAWYADVTHEVKKVTSGYRIVLTYNLIHRPSATLLGSRGELSAQLGSLLEPWTRVCNETYRTLYKSECFTQWIADEDHQENCPTSLLYLLEHEYTSAELSFARLKGVDQRRVAELLKACQQNGVYLFLASIEKTEMGSVDNYYESYDYYGHHSSHQDEHTLCEVFERALHLSKVVDPADRVVAENVNIENSFFVQDDAFAHCDPDEEDFEGYTGNEGATATHIYRQTSVLIVPAAFQFAFILHAVKKGKVDVSALLQEAHHALVTSPTDKIDREKLFHLSKVVASKECSYENYQEDVRNQAKGFLNVVTDISLKLGDMELSTQCIEVLQGSLSPTIATGIAQAIINYGLPALRSQLDKIFSPIVGTVKQLRILFGVITALSDLQRPSLDTSDEVAKWHNATLDQLLSSQCKLDEADGTFFVQVLRTSPVDDLFKRMMPFLARNVSNSAFTIAFLTSLYDAREDDKLSVEEVSETYRNLLLRALKEFRFETPVRETLVPETGWGPSSYGWWNLQPQPRFTQPDLVSSENLVKMIEQSDAMGIPTAESLEILGKKATEVQESSIEVAFHQIFLPFIIGLCHYLERIQERRAPTSAEKMFISQIITAYLNHGRPEPQRPTDWERTMSKSCHCRDCLSLHKFVADPQRQVCDFSMAERRRSHLEGQLYRTFRTTTIRVGSPHTLRVEKTYAQYDAEWKKWKERSTTAKSQIVAMAEKAPLIDVIGEKCYEEFLQHPTIQPLALRTNEENRLNSIGSIPESRSPATETLPNVSSSISSAAGLSSSVSIPRKRSFIDLT